MGRVRNRITVAIRMKGSSAGYAFALLRGAGSSPARDKVFGHRLSRRLSFSR